ncbi:MAG: alpha-amylase, partial [Acholeplasmataceae bacterium]|nr:alpha-amylase [Acholeplasmataceae bacterium]
MNILKLREILVKNKPKYPINYAIPNLFNLFGYESIKLRNGEELVNPYDFLVSLIDNVLLNKYEPLENKSLSQLRNIKSTKGNWINKSVVYSMHIRTSSSWDHDRNGSLDLNNMYNLKETGTFIKTLMLLPLLKEMGVDTLYLLPISKFSLKNKKGELGSPYSVSNFFKLDPNLGDPMVENDMTLEEQFQVLVEACHTLDIRVMIDIIPRTNATESELIIDNPEWFYWIKTKDLAVYCPPQVTEIYEKTVSPELKYMKTVYNEENVKKHIKLFQFDPKTQNPKKWEKVVSEYKKGNPNILDLVDKHFGLTIAPAFSDHINDIQPPWTDVTFFRMYLDHPKETIKYLDNPNTPPYILFDTIKSNMYHGKKPNMPLWETLSDVIPYYQKKFGIDGARIDMGHALPKELIDMIINKALEVDDDFSFIAEMLNPNDAKQAKKLGYNMIIGNGFALEYDLKYGGLHEFMLESTKYPLKQFACGETHDTPRLAARDGGQTLSKFLTVMNMFIPNTVPFINSGQEVYETQPMNLGIEPRENELYMLPEHDPYYAKLALFDKFAFHYLNHMNHDIKDNLKKVSPIRKKYLYAISNNKKYRRVEFIEGNHMIGFAYEARNELLFIIGNPMYEYAQHVKINLFNIKDEFPLVENEAFLLYGMHESGTRNITEFDEFSNPYFLMG